MSTGNVGAPQWPVLSGEVTHTKGDLELLALTAHGEHCPHQVPPAYECQCGAVLIRYLALQLMKKNP